MIQANELRIGSRVAIGVRHCIVNSIHTVPQTGECFVRVSGFIDKVPQYQVYLSELEPILLSSELLIACGFSQAFTSDPQERGASQVFKKDFTEIHQHDERENKFYWYTYEIDVQLFSLHQLQNLYFALNQQELIYKP